MRIIPAARKYCQREKPLSAPLPPSRQPALTLGRGPRGWWLVGALVVLAGWAALGGEREALGAQIVAGPPGGCHAVVMTATATRAVWVTPEGLREHVLPEVLTAVTVQGDRLSGFTADGLYDLGSGDQWLPVAPLPAAKPVREAVALPDGTLVCLVGGQWGEGGWREAEVSLWRPQAGGTWSEVMVPARFNPFRLRLGQTSDQQPLVLVGVYKTAIFDPFPRARPFVYTYSARRFALTPRWQGTSFAWPHRDVIFHRAQQLWVLEEPLTGGQRLTAYRWIGYGVEGWAVSPLGEGFGHRLQPLIGWAEGDPAGVAVYQSGTMGRQVVAWGVVNNQQGEGDAVVQGLGIVAATAPLPAAPAAWLPVQADSCRGVLVMSTDQRLKLYEWEKR